MTTTTDLIKEAMENLSEELNRLGQDGKANLEAIAKGRAALSSLNEALTSLNS